MLGLRLHGFHFQSWMNRVKADLSNQESSITEAPTLQPQGYSTKTLVKTQFVYTNIQAEGSEGQPDSIDKATQDPKLTPATAPHGTEDSTPGPMDVGALSSS